VIAGHDVSDRGAYGFDDTGTFMGQNIWQRQREMLVHDIQIGVAHPSGYNASDDFVGFWFGEL
jgi:hypothetical protein